jgi:hypothetical protein
MWHGVAQDVIGLPNSDVEDATSKYMIKALTTFAKDPVDGLSEEMGWPRYRGGEGMCTALDDLGCGRG